MLSVLLYFSTNAYFIRVRIPTALEVVQNTWSPSSQTLPSRYAPKSRFSLRKYEEQKYVQPLHHFLKRNHFTSLYITSLKETFLFSILFFPFPLSISLTQSLNTSQAQTQNKVPGEERESWEKKESLDDLMNRGKNSLWTTLLPLGCYAEKNK